MSKTLVLTEKKSVADDFARVLKGFKKRELAWERDDMVIAWASGHLLELKNPDAYDKRYKRWLLADLPIIPKKFAHEPRSGDTRSATLLKHLVKELNREDVERVVNACDAGREGELIFNLILDHAGQRGLKPTLRLWLQSMTTRSIEQAFDDLALATGRRAANPGEKVSKLKTVAPSESYKPLADAAYARDEADWLIGMNGTRALTKKFMGRAKMMFAVGRVKTPTLAFLVDREREIDQFNPVPYFQLDAVFEGPGVTWDGRWTGPDRDGKKGDRFSHEADARAILAKITGKPGIAEDHETRRKEEPPLLFDLTTLQREASSRFGYTLDRTLSLAQSLYEAKKAITYPRTSSRYLPNDYAAEIPGILKALQGGPLGHAAARVPLNAKPETHIRVFNDAKVSDHFALIPTGEAPTELRDDEMRIYEMITRRFLAVFMPSAEWLNVTRETVVAGESFVTRGRRLATAGWRSVEPGGEDKMLPALPDGGHCKTASAELLSKETMPPARYTDGSLVKAMETAGQDVQHGDDLDEETIDEIKEKGIGTPATRAAIVKDLINKGLARREGRGILPAPLGCTLVRLVRNLHLDALAKPDMTGNWEYRLAQVTKGALSRKAFSQEMIELVQDVIDKVRAHDGGNEVIFAIDHGGELLCPRCNKPMKEKTFSYMCPDYVSSKNEEDAEAAAAGCPVNFSKDQNGKYLFPETLRRLLATRVVGPLTGFQRTRAPGFLKLNAENMIEVELAASTDDADGEVVDDGPRFETVAEGTLMGKCPKCQSDVLRAGSGYKCVKNVARAKDKTCDFRLAEKIKYRFLPPAEIRKMLSGQKTEYLFGFVSMRGKRFKASLYYENGELKWEFPPRAEKKPKPGAEGAVVVAVPAAGSEAVGADGTKTAKAAPAKKKAAPRRAPAAKKKPPVDSDGAAPPVP